MPILRDTGVSQSLILEGVLLFCRESANGDVMLQRVELDNISVQLCNIYLLCDLVLGLLIVEVRPSLPVQGIAVILGNDLGSLLQTVGCHLHRYLHVWLSNLWLKERKLRQPSTIKQLIPGRKW